MNGVKFWELSIIGGKDLIGFLCYYFPTSHSSGLPNNLSSSICDFPRKADYVPLWCQLASTIQFKAHVAIIKGALAMNAEALGMPKSTKSLL